MSWSALLAGAGAALLGLEAWRNSRIGFRRLEIPMQGDYGGKRGPVRILHLSDLHITGNTTGKLDKLDYLLDMQWDFVMVSGDLIDNDSGIGPVCEWLGGFEPSCGTFTVLGNHDFNSVSGSNPVEWLKVFGTTVLRGECSEVCSPNDVELLGKHLAANGVNLLRNEMAGGELPGGGEYQVIGIDDPSTDRDDPSKLYSRVRSAALRIVLTHAPTRIGGLAPLGPEIVLCGHTHGGQIRVPGIGALATHSDAGRGKCMGLQQMAGCRVHISPGAATGRLFPLRLFARAEVTEVVLYPDSHG